MSRFPSREADVIGLLDRMIAGYLGHPGVFVSADVAVLQSERAAYAAAREAQVSARAEYALATEAKERALDAVKLRMHRELHKSITDTVEDPKLLKLIGSGPRSKAVPNDPPGQPRSLEAVSQGPSTLHLDWKHPSPHSGGPIRDYIVERREFEGGVINEWHDVGDAIETQVQLKGQPRGVSMEYRVVAVNVGGRSEPSNIVDVVL